MITLDIVESEDRFAMYGTFDIEAVDVKVLDALEAKLNEIGAEFVQLIQPGTFPSFLVRKSKVASFQVDRWPYQLHIEG